MKIERGSEIKVEDLQRIALSEGDAPLARFDMSAVPPARSKQYADALKNALKNALKSIFPNNKVIVFDKRVELSVITQGVVMKPHFEVYLCVSADWRRVQ